MMEVKIEGQTENKQVDWEKIIDLYLLIKTNYALCEETDPELCTNLQPLNEFRAALDHMMRIAAIQNLDAYSQMDAIDESRKLYSHLRRAFFDVCDMLSINYRNKIIDTLRKFDTDCIQTALPDYYSTMRPRIEAISERIASVRTDGRFNENDTERSVVEYSEMVNDLKKYYNQVLAAESTLCEIRTKSMVKKVIFDGVIPAAGVILAIIGFFF